MKSIFFQTLSCGLSRGLSLGYCWLIHCFCSCCKVRFCFGSGQPQQPSATRFWSWLVFLSPVLCVLSARPACTNQSLRLRVFLEILLRNRSAQIVGCVVVVFFCLKENITDFVFVLLFKQASELGQTLNENVLKPAQEKVTLEPVNSLQNMITMTQGAIVSSYHCFPSCQSVLLLGWFFFSFLYKLSSKGEASNNSELISHQRRVNECISPCCAFLCLQESVEVFTVRYSCIDFMVSAMEDGLREKYTQNGWRNHFCRY